MKYSLQLRDAKSARMVIFFPTVIFMILAFLLGPEIHKIVGFSLSLFVAIMFFLYRSHIIDRIEIEDDLVLYCGTKSFRESLQPDKIKLFRIFANPWFVLVLRVGKFYPRLFFGSYFNTDRGTGSKVVSELRKALGK